MGHITANRGILSVNQVVVVVVAVVVAATAAAAAVAAVIGMLTFFQPRKVTSGVSK